VVTIQSAATVPTGAVSEFTGLTFSSGSLTKIAGLHTTHGCYELRGGNATAAGVPAGGFTRFDPFLTWTRYAWTAPATAQYAIQSAATVPTGAVSEFTGLTFSSGTLTKIAGLHTTHGCYMQRPATLYAAIDGAWELKKIADLLLSIAGAGIPAVTIPGAIPLVQILE
jgi:hypothetical protein